MLPKFIAKTYLFGINDAGNNKKNNNRFIDRFLLTTRLKIKMHTIVLIILTLVEFSSSKKKSIISLKKNKK